MKIRLAHLTLQLILWSTSIIQNDTSWKTVANTWITCRSRVKNMRLPCTLRISIGAMAINQEALASSSDGCSEPRSGKLKLCGMTAHQFSCKCSSPYSWIKILGRWLHFWRISGNGLKKISTIRSRVFSSPKSCVRLFTIRFTHLTSLCCLWAIWQKMWPSIKIFSSRQT